jgi:Zn-dependent M28 family amino/carboxypeptidase
MRIVACVLVVAGAVGLHAQVAAHPRDKEIHDVDTLAWWHTTEALSGDAMEGRDTGTAAYQRAAEYVAARFRAAGLKPAGEEGGYFQVVPLHQVDVLPEGTSFTVVREKGSVELGFLEEITIGASARLPERLEAPLTFRGYCGKEAMADVAGKIVVCFGTQREGLPSGGERAANARAGKAAGIVNVNDPYFTIEPPRWPAAYSRSVTFAGAAPRGGDGPTMAAMTLSDEAFAKLIEGSGQDVAALLKAGGTKQPLKSFEIPAKLRVRLKVSEKDVSSPNVLAVLPGSDPKLAGEYVVASAHLDGYGYGTAVKGDSLYNGALDDAAYVALLIQMADDVKAGKLPAPKRSILFCAFMGEEKGLLGSNWFVRHPTVPVAQMVADVNLDQLRPLFPLKIMTAEALGESTLGQTAKDVAGPMGIEIRPDMEPERGLIHRADEFPFLSVLHVPGIGFVFGYDPGTEAEKRYREWYQVRYHRPQDDLTQPMDFGAALTFDTFFYGLVEKIANDAARPAMLAGSQFGGK